LEEQQAGETLKESEREELKRLRKEVKNLTMEKEVPKKAAPSLRRK
jgi:transposase